MNPQNIKMTVEYFPHYTQSGKTIYVLEREYGNDGYAFWFKLLEILGSTNKHYLNCSSQEAWNYLLDRIGFEESLATKILATLSEVNAIDKELWNDHRIIWSENFVNNLAPLYARRRQLPTRPVVPHKISIPKKEEKKESIEVKENIKEEDIDLTVGAWNSYVETRKELSKVRRLSEARKRKLKKRLSEGFDIDLIIKNIEKQPFLWGNNNSGWKVTFDWLIVNDNNYVKVLEGAYVKTKKTLSRIDTPEISEDDPIYSLKEPTF